MHISHISHAPSAFVSTAPLFDLKDGTSLFISFYILSFDYLTFDIVKFQVLFPTGLIQVQKRGSQSAWKG